MPTIKIHPFSSIDPMILADLENEIQSHFRIDAIVGEDLPLPANSFSKSRKQFLAGAFLQLLAEVNRSDPAAIHIGITDVDLYAPGLNFVFGQADQQSQAAIFSIARLDPCVYGESADDALLLRRAIKEAIHELGHVFGLQHCPNESCVMWFSNSLDETDRKGTDFCPQCARRYSSRLQKAA